MIPGHVSALAVRPEGANYPVDQALVGVGRRRPHNLGQGFLCALDGVVASSARWLGQTGAAALEQNTGRRECAE